MNPGGDPKPANFLSDNLQTFQPQPANFSAPTCKLFTQMAFTENYYMISDAHITNIPTVKCIPNTPPTKHPPSII